MLYLILAEAGLELIPASIGDHNSVRKNIKRFGDIGKILDISYHRRAMYKLPNFHKRGRPDIVYKFLLDAQSSILNKWGLLRIYIQTYTGAVYEFNPLMKPPKEYLRFKGLMYKLLTEGFLTTPIEDAIFKNTFFDEKYKIQNTNSSQNIKSNNKNQNTPNSRDLSNEGNNSLFEERERFLKPILFARSILDSRKKSNIPITSPHREGPPFDFLDINHYIKDNELVLARRLKMNLRKLISYLKVKYLIKFTSRGALMDPSKIFVRYNLDDDIIAIIGGFQRGTFSDSIKTLVGEEISIFPDNLEASSVVNRVLINYENFILQNFK
ncbi:MAG: hypothetical protein ACTSRZ_03090 [Promethearchaeota archaeon]